jgi:hypothetical protein
LDIEEKTLGIFSVQRWMECVSIKMAIVVLHHTTIVSWKHQSFVQILTCTNVQISEASASRWVAIKALALNRLAIPGRRRDQGERSMAIAVQAFRQTGALFQVRCDGWAIELGGQDRDGTGIGSPHPLGERKWTT